MTLPERRPFDHPSLSKKKCNRYMIAVCPLCKFVVCLAAQPVDGKLVWAWTTFITENIRDKYMRVLGGSV